MSAAVETYPLQDPEYVDDFETALADVFSRTYEATSPAQAPDEWARAIRSALEESGWRFVTAADWDAMTGAWTIQMLR